MILAILVISCSESPTGSKDQLKLLFSPSELDMNTTGTEIILIDIEDAEDLFCASMEIVFVDEILDIDNLSFVEGDFWSGSTISYSNLEACRYSVFVGLQQTSQSDGLSGNGTLFRFNVIASGAGLGNMTLENISLLNENGEAIDGFDELEIEGLSITVDLD